MKSLSNSIFLVALALLLTACGGGGGSPSSSPQPTDLTSGKVRVAAATQGREQFAAQKAATALPRFGSVTQSSNQNINGVSTDTIDTSFSGVSNTGGQLRTTITRQGRGPIVLDGEVRATGTGLGMPSDQRLSGQSEVLNLGSSTATLGLIKLDWSSSNPADYLALGYWIHAIGNFSISEPEINSVEIGAFADGPEIDGPRVLPATGTATYNGEAAGLYTIGSPGSQGNTDLGEFLGDIRLTADFSPSARSISGTVDNIKLATVDNDGAGEYHPFPEYRIRLGTAMFDDDSGFRGDVVITYDGDSSNSEGGSWGGRFSNRDDSAGNPRLVAGTLGGNTRRGDDGVPISFVGTFYGATDNFR